MSNPGGKVYSREYEIKYVLEKHRRFVEGSMTGKCVRHLPGVEETLGEKLVDGGFFQAYQLLGQYLLFRKENFRFIDWMTESFGATKREATDCCFALEAWAEEYL